MYSDEELIQEIMESPLARATGISNLRFMKYEKEGIE